VDPRLRGGDDAGFCLRVLDAGPARVRARQKAESSSLSGDVLGRRFFRAQQREQDDVAYRTRIGEQHGEAIDPDAFPPGRWQAVTKGADIVFVDGVGGQVTLFTQQLLILEAIALFGGVIEFAEGVLHFHAGNVKLEALNEIRVVSLLFGKRRDFKWVIQNEGRLYQLAFCHMLEEFGKRHPRGGALR